MLTPPSPLADRIRALRLELAALEQQQRTELLHQITTAFPPGEVFSAGQLWQQPELRAACVDAGLATSHQLGIWLRSGCTRLYRDDVGVMWTVDGNERQTDAGARVDDRL